MARRNASRAGLFGFIALVFGAIAAWFGGGIGTPRKVTAALETSRGSLASVGRAASVDLR
jgi:hypothetical protein